MLIYKLLYVIMTHNIGVRIDDKLLNDVKELGVNISETVREALIKEVARRKTQALRESLHKLEEMLADENPQDYIRLIRESRDQR